MLRSGTGQDVSDAYAVLEEALRVTAPDNWPLLIEALSEACDEYVAMYEHIYSDAHLAQKSGSSRPETRTIQPFAQSRLLTSIETTLLGWEPVPMPHQDHAATTSLDADNKSRYIYQQVSHRGLPYLLRISTTPLAVQRSQALATLLHRITTLGNMIDKLENVIMLGTLIQSQPLHSSTASSVPGAIAPTQLNGAAAAGRALALEQGGVIAGASHFVQSILRSLRGITVADVTAVIMPMAMISFKLGILLSVMLRGADPFKWYFVLGMASIYVVFESYRIVQRRMRARQRMALHPAAAAQLPQHEVQAAAANNNAGPAADAAPRTDGAPMVGANVPSAPLNEQAAERQATEDPFRPLPPPQAPPRLRSRTRFSYDWCIDCVALLGLDAEDVELGLLPASGARTREASWVERVLNSEWLLPILLFVVTMMPAVEQRRRRAIEERERVIRKWTRLEQERRQRVVELQEKQAAERGDAPDSPDSPDSPGALGGAATAMLSVAEVGMQDKRAEYVDRMLRQRRTTEAVDLDDDDGASLARQMQEEQDGDMDIDLF